MATAPPLETAAAWPRGASAMAHRIRTQAWDASPLGPPATWPPCLRAVTELVLAAATPMAVYWGPDLALIYNDAWRLLLGDKDARALGAAGRDVFPEIWHLVGPMLAGVRDGAGPVEQRDHLLPIDRGAGLEDAWFDYTANPIPTMDGAIGGVLNIAFETTHRVLARAAREAELREAERRKDEFLAVLAHELRNPLAPLRTAIEVLGLAPPTPEGVAELRAMMARQVDHMIRLVDDLLDISRIARDQLTLRRAPAQLRTLIDTALEVHRAALAAKGLEVAAVIDEELILDVDATRVVQVLSNLLHNAGKFTPPGGRITVTAAPRGDMVAITVADTGEGVPAAFLPRMFELFAQAAPTHPRAENGLGIGLALARRLVELHGGRIEATSAGPGQGTQITLTLARAAATDRAPHAAPAPAPASRRVLIIDDNRDAARAIALLVRSLGGEADVVHAGAHGLTHARAARPDVVLLDIGMPGMDGYETCRQLRAEVGPEVAIVAVTGWGQDEDKRRALDAGFDAHLTKPAGLAELRAVLGL